MTCHAHWAAYVEVAKKGWTHPHHHVQDASSCILQGQQVSHWGITPKTTDTSRVKIHKEDNTRCGSTCGYPDMPWQVMS